MNYADELQELGLSDTQIVTILSGWSNAAIESLLRGEKEPPSMESIMTAILIVPLYQIFDVFFPPIAATPVELKRFAIAAEPESRANE